jgi:putative membrane protein
MSSDARKLHPAAIGVLAIGALRDAAIPIVILLFTAVAGSGGLDTGALERGAAYLVLGVAIAAITGFVRWRSTRYRVDEHGVHWQTGIVRKRQTTVPLDRVQGIDTVAGPVQRLFGVVAVNVQSAGGGAKGEIVLEAVGLDAVEQLRDAVRARRPEAPEAPAGALRERRLNRRDGLIAALTAGQLGVILPVLAGAAQLLSNVFQDERGVEDATRLAPDTLGGWELALAALIVAAWALSVAGSLVAFAGFTVARDGERLRIRRGLLQRSEAAVPVRRVQGVRVIEGLLRRPFGLCALRIEVAGYAEEASAARTLFPLLRRAAVGPFLAELLPELADDPFGLAPPPKRAARRYVLPPALVGTALGGGAWLAFGTPWPLLLAPLLALDGWLDYRAAGWRLRDGRLAMSSRTLAWSTLLAPAARLQQHSIAQNPLQRRAGLADLAVAVGKGGHARVRHLEEPVAADLWQRLRR